MRTHLVGVEYIKSDYAEGVQYLVEKCARQPIFDLALFLRILHNASEFCVTAANPADAAIKNGRYTPDAAVSDYYRLFPRSSRIWRLASQ